MQNTFKLLVTSAFLAISCHAGVKAQLTARKGDLTITYYQRKEISADDFFQKKMAVEKYYKVAGRKFEIFFEKDNYLYCGKRLSGNKEIKLDTLYIILKDELIQTFPDYHVDGYQVRNVIYEYLKKNIPEYRISGLGNNFTYTVDKSIITVVYEQITHRYIARKSRKFYIKINAKDLTILEFKTV